MSPEQYIVVCFGGGTNSTALLIGMKERGVRPDAILFADTGGEKPETYRHVERMQAWLQSRQFPLIAGVAQPISLEQACLDRETLPAKAFGFGSCSDHFKIRPQRKWLRDAGVKNPVWHVGIHADELRRAQRVANDRGEQIKYPLIEWGWRQADCQAAIIRAGLPLPVKSACFFCPSSRKTEVLRLAKEHPDLFERAVQMERVAKEAGTLTTIRGLGRHWSWESLAAADASQLRLFDDIQAPICETCLDG